ncbi:MAG TPA: nucleotidyltransferase family protein [Terriglobales bacterium]|nr:nucleotidyltransferase family protein [Terriglobales bacterium]
MKAFLLAAGHGTRLRPLTDDCPKCLLPIQHTPMLEIWFDLCRRYGIKEILVNVHAHADRVKQFVRANGKDLRVHVIEEPVLLGSAGTIRANQDWVANESLFWIFYADVLTSTNLSAMLSAHTRRNPVATLGVYRVSNPKRCGIVTLGPDNIIEDFIEKPEHPASNLAFSGLIIATPKLLSAIPAHHPCDIGFDLLPRLRGSMLAYPIPDFLLDIGTRETYESAQNIWPGLECVR